MNEFRADLHCHTTCSDGTETPQQLIQLASSIGLQGLSITDHDSIEAFEMALPFAEKAGIKLLTGAEFSSVHKGSSIHILAYSFTPKHPLLAEFCIKHHERRLNRNREILELLKKHGMPVEENEVEAILPGDLPAQLRTIGRPHIAQVMIKKGYVETIVDAFKKYIGEGKPCYTAGKPFSSEETIDMIHRANGLAVIAHPHLIEESHILKDLINMPFDGIECYYGNFAMIRQERWLKLAKKKKWLITGGSDFHGTIKPAISLGSSFVSEELFNILYFHFLKQKNGLPEIHAPNNLT